MGGYIDSQTWEAWLESYEVLWDNTSLVFVASVILSLVLVVATWLMNTPHHSSNHGQQNKGEMEKLQDIQEMNLEGDSEQELEEENEKSIEKLLEMNQCFPGEMRKVPRRVLEKTVEKQMSEEQRQAEREVQSQQLAAIFKMMQDQEDKFGQTTIDEIKDQMKLYCS